MNEEVESNEPFDAEKEKLAYEKYCKKEKIVYYKDEKIALDYKKNIILNANSKKDKKLNS